MSQPFVQLLDNGPLAWGLAACGLAQLSKLLIELVVHRRCRKSKQRLIKSLLKANARRRARDQSGMGRGHATGFDQHRRTPAAIHHQLNQQLGELSQAASGKAPGQGAVIEQLNEWLTHRSREVMYPARASSGWAFSLQGFNTPQASCTNASARALDSSSPSSLG